MLSSTDFAHKSLIRVKNPRFAFAQALRIFAPSEPKVYRGHPSHGDYWGKRNVWQRMRLVHALAVVGDNVSIGDNCVVYPFVYIGDNVSVGDNCVIYPACRFAQRYRGRQVCRHT